MVHTHGHVLTAPPSPTRVPVEPLLSYQIRDLSLPMRSPTTPGIYESKWRMSTASGLFFGDTIWVIITVERAGTLALTQQMDSFEFQSPEEQQQQQHQQPPRNPFSPKKTG